MMNPTYRPIALSALAMRSILPFLLIFVMLASMLVDDASARTRSRTVGGTTTDLHHHGITLKCTWEEFQGVWDSVADYTKSPPEISVTHSVGDPVDPSNQDYAICGGWALGFAPSGSLTNPDGTPNTEVLYTAPYGWGYFYYNATYASTTATTCIEDPNSGIGNNCVKFTDEQNKKHGGGDPVPNYGATLACADNNPGTKLTYQFNCADGVYTRGFVTLVPSPYGGTLMPEDIPDFTGPCSPKRVEAGKCTMQIGGVPTKTVKIKGQNVTVVDTNACLEAFPEDNIPNALGSLQTQLLAAGAILYYEETAYQGSCDPDNNNLPTVDGAPTAAFGRECTSDMEPFPQCDEVGDNCFPNDPPDVDGFDNELRVCYKESNKDTAHTNVHDVETVELANITVDAGPTFNLNCTSGGNTDSGKYKVLISDQAALLAGNVHVTPLIEAPTLEGVSPIKAVINTDELGVDTLELTYPTCEELTANIIEQGPGPEDNLGSEDNNTNVTLELIGQTEPTETSLNQTIKALIEVKVNGL